MLYPGSSYLGAEQFADLWDFKQRKRTYRHTMGTERLYLSDSYQASFSASVMECKPLENGRFAVILDKTFFYPASGGQLSDRGRVGDAEVIYVRESCEGEVMHEVSKNIQEQVVDCRIVWPARFDHMQQHTGQHILSRAFIEICNAETVSFHMGIEDCTIDLNKVSIDNEMLCKAEEKANSVICSNRNVIINNLPPKELKGYDLRTPVPPGIDNVRLVIIEDFDVCACCGTHVAKTGELGVIKIIRSEKVKDKTRVHFKVGIRAYKDYSDKHNIISSLARRFTTSPLGLEGKVDKLIDENKEYKNLLKKKNKKLIAIEKKELLRKAELHRGKRIIVDIVEGSDGEYLRLLSSSFKNEEGVIVLLASENGAMVCNTSSDLKGDYSEYIVNAARKFGGTGGGKGGFASVSFPPSADIKSLLKEVYESVKRSI